jgi:hypothetical protein
VRASRTASWPSVRSRPRDPFTTSWRTRTSTFASRFLYELQQGAEADEVDERRRCPSGTPSRPVTLRSPEGRPLDQRRSEQ